MSSILQITVLISKFTNWRRISALAHQISWTPFNGGSLYTLSTPLLGLEPSHTQNSLAGQPFILFHLKIDNGSPRMMNFFPNQSIVQPFSYNP